VQPELLQADEEAGGQTLLEGWLVVRMRCSGAKPQPKRGRTN
jgi:hypothetical protein